MGPVLGELGLDNRVLLQTASDKFVGTVHVPEILEKLSLENRIQNRTIWTIQSLTGSAGEQWGSEFHEDGEIEGDALEDRDVQFDLWEDPIQELDVLLQERAVEALTAGMSRNGSEN